MYQYWVGLFDQTLHEPTNRGHLFSPFGLSPRLRSGVEAMRAQHWSLASQHGMYRLVPVMVPHHRPVQQPKAFVVIEQAD